MAYWLGVTTRLCNPDMAALVESYPQGVAWVGVSMTLEAKVVEPILAKVRIGTTASRVAIAAMRTMIPRGVRTVFTTKFPFISQIPF